MDSRDTSRLLNGKKNDSNSQRAEQSQSQALHVRQRPMPAVTRMRPAIFKKIKGAPRWLIIFYDVLAIISSIALLGIAMFISWPNEMFRTHRPYSIKPLRDVDQSLIRNPFIYRFSSAADEGYGDIPTELIFPKDRLPEGLHSIAVDTKNTGVVYVAGKNNTIYSVDNTTDTIKFVTKLCDVGECDSPSIVFHNNSLYLSSLDLGIVNFNPETRQAKIITYPQHLEGDDQDLKVPLVKEMSAAPDGKIYWTDYSLAHEYYSDDDYFEAFFMDPFGRLVEYDPVENKHRILLSNLAMPGGVQVSADGSYVLVAETLAARIRIFYLKGLWKGRSEVYIERLPGLPYGIQLDGEAGHITVSLITVIGKRREEPWLPHAWAEDHLLRRMMFRALYYSRMACSALFKPLNRPFCFAHKLLYEFYASPFYNEGSMVLKINNTKNSYGLDVGEIVEEERFYVDREAGGVMNLKRHGSYFYSTAFGGKTFIKHKARDNSSLIVSRCRIPREMMGHRITRTHLQVMRAKAKNADKREPSNPIYLDPWMYEDVPE